MRLICELTENVHCISEEKDGKKTLYLEGVFMQADIKNKNGRLYPNEIMGNEVSRYMKETVASNRAYGELGHPTGPQINLDRVSHMVESLKMDGSNVVGRARIVETPMGNIVKGLLEGGANLGVSSRGLGSLKPVNGLMEVQNDFRLVTAADIVADPSAPGAFVKGIMENVEWYLGTDGQITASEFVKKTAHKLSKRQLEEAQIRLFKFFLRQCS